MGAECLKSSKKSWWFYLVFESNFAMSDPPPPLFMGAGCLKLSKKLWWFYLDSANLKKATDPPPPYSWALNLWNRPKSHGDSPWVSSQSLQVQNRPPPTSHVRWMFEIVPKAILLWTAPRFSGKLINYTAFSQRILKILDNSYSFSILWLKILKNEEKRFQSSEMLDDFKHSAPMKRGRDGCDTAKFDGKIK